MSAYIKSKSPSEIFQQFLMDLQQYRINLRSDIQLPVDVETYTNFIIGAEVDRRFHTRSYSDGPRILHFQGGGRHGINILPPEAAETPYEKRKRIKEEIKRLTFQLYKLDEEE